MFRGALQTMPRLMGLPDAQVEMVDRGSAVLYTVDLPRRCGIIARMRRWLASPVSGTVFEVALPLTEAVPVSDAPTQPVDVPEAEGSILIVDDEKVVREVARAMLQRAGYRTFCVGDGTEAVEFVRSRGQEIVAVLLDLTMPGMSGEQTFQELRRIHESLPVVCCSGLGEEFGQKWIEGKSHVSFVAKPFRRQRILESLRELL